MRSVNGLPELIPANVRAMLHQPKGRRVNLVLPFVVREGVSFGGVQTVVRFFERMCADFEYARVIYLNSREPESTADIWPRWELDRGAFAPRSIEFIENASSSLEICANDLFVATSWNTAFYIREVIENQSAMFKQKLSRYVYFIQEYEPGFHSWSERCSYARSAYDDADGAIVVFNSAQLAQFFNENGIRFSTQYVLEPVLHPILQRKKVETAEWKKERLILVYARPEYPRNAFPLAVESLKHWASHYPSAKQWTVVSAGQRHEDIDLGCGSYLRSLGKLSMEQYGEHLSRCWVGLSFMYLVHASYSRFELAEFGSWVVTNRFEGNDISEVAPNFICIDNPRPRDVADKLTWCCNQYQSGRSAAVGSRAPVFSTDEDEFTFAKSLIDSWQIGT